MASYNELNALIDAYINRNGVQAITGQILNGVLKAMVEQLGRGYTIMGAAIPTTDPGTPDGPECYFASNPGTYTDFDGLQIVPGELALLCYTPTDGWTKETIYEGFQTVGATIDENVGIPSVGVSYADGVLSFDFHNMKGNPGQNGQDGAAAGFGTIGADIAGGVGTPGVTVESSGPATAKNLQFHFTNLKGETGVTSVVATVDNTTGNPACTVSLVGQQLTLAFSGLKGAQGDTGSSVDYPFTIVNNLTTDDATQALSAAQGVVLQGEITQLEAKVTDLEDTVYGGIVTEPIDIADCQKKNNYIDANNLWASGNKTSFIPVKDYIGGTISIKTSYYWGSNFAFLKNDIVQVGSTPDFCIGHIGRITLSSNTEVTETIPGDAEFVAVRNDDQDSTFTISVTYNKVGLIDETKDLANNIEATNSFSNSVTGFIFGDKYGDIVFKNALKYAWVDILDDSVELGDLYISVFRNQSTGDNQCVILITDENNSAIFSVAYPTKQSGIKEIAWPGYSTYNGKVVLHLIMDFSIVTTDYNYQRDLGTISTSLSFDSLNHEQMETRDLHQQVFVNSKPLFGKNIVCFGDSITEFVGDERYGYCDYLGIFSGANVINAGFGGAQIRQRTTPVLNPTTSTEGYAGMDIINVIRAVANVQFDTDHTYRDVLENSANYIYTTIGDDNRAIVARLLAVDWAKVDAVTFLAGTNDWINGGNQRGTTDSTDAGTTLGAINEIIRILLTAYPKLKIYWFTPTIRWVATSLEERTPENWGDNYVTGGVTLKQLSAMIAEDVELRKIPVCDLYNTLGWNTHNFSAYFRDSDGTHPFKGFKEIGKKMMGFLVANNTF